jgi:hypothetical protein
MAEKEEITNAERRFKEVLKAQGEGARGSAKGSKRENIILFIGAGWWMLILLVIVLIVIAIWVSLN